LRFSSYPVPKDCPYCGAEEIMLTTNDYLYGRKFPGYNGNCNIYVCIICNASVGTHYDGITPLGRLADKELKELKKQAHALFDPHWKPDKKKRDRAYKTLAKKLSIRAEECHFGWFDKVMLLKAIEVLEKWRPRKKRA